MGSNSFVSDEMAGVKRSRARKTKVMVEVSHTGDISREQIIRALQAATEHWVPFTKSIRSVKVV